MKIQNLKYSNYKIFNPATKEIIVDEECHDNAKSLIGYWLDDSIDNPIISHEALKTAWKAFVENPKQDEGDFPSWEDLIKFLEEYNNPSWIGYEITSYGMPCYSVLYIVEKDVIVKGLDEYGIDNKHDDDQK